ncbi:MAG: hypothetical protein ACK51T_05415 [bacterium]
MSSTTRTILLVGLVALPLGLAGGYLYNKLGTTRAELASAKGEIGTLKGKVSAAELQLNMIEMQKSKLSETVGVLDTQLKAVHVEAEALNVSLGGGGADLKVAVGKVAELQQRAEQISLELEATKKTAGALQVQNTQLSGALSKAESELGSARSLIKDLQGQVAGLESRLKEQAVAHAAKVEQMTTQITGLEQVKTELQAAVVTTRAELSAFQSDPDTRLLGAKVQQFRRSAVGRNHAQQAIGILGGLFDFIGNESMKGTEARKGPQGEPYWAIVFRDNTQQEIAEDEVGMWQRRIERISTLWQNQQRADASVQPVIR